MRVLPAGLRRVAPFLLALALATGCGPRVARETAFEQGGTKIVLRSQTRGGEPLGRGFAHPAQIAPARLAHVLARIDVRKQERDPKQREPAIPAELLQEIAAGLSIALAKATPAQEVAVTSRRRERRFGIFTNEYLTSFVAYVKDDRLQLHLSHLEWPIPKGPNVEIPEPRAEGGAMRFRVLPAEAMQATGPQALAIDWRDRSFEAGAAVRVSPTGRVRRRTILLESPEPAPPASAPAPALAPETLRKLADLEEARRRGALSEAEYSARREAILHEDAATR